MTAVFVVVLAGSAEGSESFNPLAEGCPAAYEGGNEPDAPDITFKTFRRSPLGPSIPIKIDQWDPAIPPVTSAPAVVLFHGGGMAPGVPAPPADPGQGAGRGRLHRVLL